MSKQEIRFVFVKGPQYVALDQSSGGYPHMVDSIWRAKLWTDKAAALRYQHTMRSESGKWVLHSVEAVETAAYVSKAELAEARGDKEYAEFLRLSKIYGAAGEAKCVFSEAWVGRCNKATVVGEEFCERHLKEKCATCGEQAYSSCGHTSQFVCGYGQCKTHKHHSDG